MTDPTDHRAAAERLLNDANEWAAQAGELSPEASEMTCLAYAQIHAMLAIHDALTAAGPAPNPPTATHPWPMTGLTHTRGAQWDAADRYALNEERQRAAEPDPLDEEPLPCRECGHEIDSHPHEYEFEGYCECDWRPSQVARALIEQAVKQAGGGRA